jgi:predicted nuclease with TOPRIM domain
MRERLEARVGRLRQELEAGQARLRELEVEQAFLRERLLMLKGAIQALDQLGEELRMEPDGQPEPGTRERAG